MAAERIAALLRNIIEGQTLWLFEGSIPSGGYSLD
jgi:hypothetical protein